MGEGSLLRGWVRAEVLRFPQECAACVLAAAMGVGGMGKVGGG